MRKGQIKRAKFVESYLLTGNATESAAIAGYKHPGQRAYDLLNNDEVQARIEEFQQKSHDDLLNDSKGWGLSVKDTLTMLEDLARNSENEIVRTKCLELFMKKHALLTDKIISQEKAVLEVQSVLRE